MICWIYFVALNPSEASTIDLCIAYYRELHDGPNAEPIEIFSYQSEFGIGLPFTQLYLRNSSMNSICLLRQSTAARKVGRSAARPLNNAEGFHAPPPVGSDVQDPHEDIDSDAAALAALEADENGDGEDLDDDAMLIELQDNLLHSLAAQPDDSHDETGEHDEPAVEDDTVATPPLFNGALPADAVSTGTALWRGEITNSLNCLREHAESISAVPVAVGAYGEMSLAGVLKSSYVRS